jgi:integrase
MPRKAQPKRVATADGFAVRGRNARGAGSEYQEADGSWRATYRDHNGKTRRVRGRTKTEAIERRATKLAELGERRPQHERFTDETTVGELLEWWLANVAAHKVRPTSLDRYRFRAARVCDKLGNVAVGELTVEGLTAWQTEQLRHMASGTVRDIRQVIAQGLRHAVDLGLITRSPLDRVPHPRVVRKPGVALTARQARDLLAVSSNHRYAAVFALLFVQGWRVSEALGLASEDLDLEAGIATVRRAAVDLPGTGVIFGPTKTDGARGQHHLADGVVELLRERQVRQEQERVTSAMRWPTHRYEDTKITPVFTTAIGALVRRQTIDSAIRHFADSVGLDHRTIGTHTGRRTVVTVLYAEAGVDLADIAQHVGHGDTAVTAGYVRDLGSRPERTASAAFMLLDRRGAGERNGEHDEGEERAPVPTTPRAMRRRSR